MAKILYVEDERDVFELARRWLTRNQHEVFHAFDGPTALASATTEQPDLILLDVMLGEFSDDGWEINRQLKAQPATRRIPVVCFSASAQRPGIRERALNEGFIGHLSKPFDKTSLMSCVTAHLSPKDAS